jgi:hypothetical protein
MVKVEGQFQEKYTHPSINTNLDFTYLIVLDDHLLKRHLLCYKESRTIHVAAE